MIVKQGTQQDSVRVPPLPHYGTGIHDQLARPQRLMARLAEASSRPYSTEIKIYKTFRGAVRECIGKKAFTLRGSQGVFPIGLAPAGLHRRALPSWADAHAISSGMMPTRIPKNFRKWDSDRREPTSFPRKCSMWLFASRRYWYIRWAQGLRSRIARQFPPTSISKASRWISACDNLNRLISQTPFVAPKGPPALPNPSRTEKIRPVPLSCRWIWLLGFRLRGRGKYRISTHAAILPDYQGHWTSLFWSFLYLIWELWWIVHKQQG